MTAATKPRTNPVKPNRPTDVPMAQTAFCFALVRTKQRAIGHRRRKQIAVPLRHTSAKFNNPLRLRGSARKFHQNRPLAWVLTHQKQSLDHTALKPNATQTKQHLSQLD
jgi:hypothetical protein